MLFYVVCYDKMYVLKGQTQCTDSDMARLEGLFKIAGIKYDIHFSRLYNRDVIRVLEQDMPKLTHSQQQPKTIEPNILYGLKNNTVDK